MQQHRTDGRTQATQKDDERRARREFLKQTGKVAIAVPAMAILLKAEKASAEHTNAYSDGPTSTGSFDAQTTSVSSTSTSYEGDRGSFSRTTTSSTALRPRFGR